MELGNFYEHEVFFHYAMQQERRDGDYDVNIVGCKTKFAYEMPDEGMVFRNIHTFPSGKTRSKFGNDSNPERSFRCSEDYYEWIDLLEAIRTARGHFTMIELGAGYGRWIANAACAAQRLRDRKNLEVRLIAVEADERRFQWMLEHLSANGIDPDSHLLLNAGISDQRSQALMRISSIHEYGESVVGVGASQIPALVNQKVNRVYVNGELDPYRIIDVLPISEVVSRAVSRWEDSVIDFMDIDIQGAEETAIEHSIDALNKYVKRMHIGTHSKKIEETLYDLLVENEWQILRLYPMNSVVQGEFGRFQSADGIMSCLNTKFK